MQDRKRHVLLTAQRLFIEKGFNATSVQDILNESNISKGTFYNYFTSKNECLIAIIEAAQNDIIVRRKNILVGHHPSDKHVLERQISIRFEVTRKHHLLQLFEAIFHSDDDDLREFVKQYHRHELSWLATRLVDVYGKEAEHYAPDCAVIMLGMLQHLLQVWAGYTNKQIQSASLISFTMRRIDTIMKDLMETNDILFGDFILDPIYQNCPSKHQLLEEITQLRTLLRGNNKATEYVQFITSEIRSDAPRKYLLHSVLLSLRQEIGSSHYEVDALSVLSKVEQYVDLLQQEDK